MLFVKREPVIVDDPVARAEASRLAEERGQATGAAAVLGVVAFVIALGLVLYFAWWVPSQRPAVTPVVHDTKVIEDHTGQSAPPTIINNTPPPVIEHDTAPPVTTTGGGASTGGTATGDNSGGSGSGSNNGTGDTTGSGSGTGDTTTTGGTGG